MRTLYGERGKLLMKKLSKYIYVVSLTDKEYNNLYLAPNGKITSDFVRWNYEPNINEIINIINNENIISFEVAKANPFMVKVLYKGYRKEM